MKKILFIFISLLLHNSSFSQDIPTLLKIHETSDQLGIISNISIDTMLLKSRYERVNRRISEQQLTLLKAAECYLNNDFENSLYNIMKVEIRFRNNDFNNLKFFLLIGTFANLNKPNEAGKYFYIANKSNIIVPQNMVIIKNEIKNSLTKEAFEKGLKKYYYYHQRMKIIADIFD